MNQLGNTELINTDSYSWVCKSDDGNFQVLFWDFNYTYLNDSINNQEYFLRDL